MIVTETVLDRIVASKKRSLLASKQHRTYAQLERDVAKLAYEAVPNFYDAIKADVPYPKIIGEIKKSSPSSGRLKNSYTLSKINAVYQATEQVVAISVITEVTHFQGSKNTLKYVASHNTFAKPLLRKDFLFDPYQLLESKLLGAQAFLLIAALFNFSELNTLIQFGLSLGMEPLIEIHNQQELVMALRTKARCIGANSRNLKNFNIDLSIHELLREIDDSYVRIAESGITESDYLQYLMKFCDGALIGSHFMQSTDLSRSITKISQASKIGRVL